VDFENDPRIKAIWPANMNIVISSSDRAEEKLTKRFDNLDHVWSAAEFRVGKRLRVDDLFNYRNASQSSVQSSDERGRSLAIQWMLEKRAKQIYAKEDSTGQPSNGPAKSQ
jgi:hypothetical protein